MLLNYMLTPSGVSATPTDRRHTTSSGVMDSDLTTYSVTSIQSTPAGTTTESDDETIVMTNSNTGN